MKTCLRCGEDVNDAGGEFVLCKHCWMITGYDKSGVLAKVKFQMLQRIGNDKELSLHTVAPPEGTLLILQGEKVA